MTQRANLVARLRKLADLLESSEEVVCHGVDVAFFPHSAREVKAIMGALDLPWKISRDDGDDRLNFKGRTGNAGGKEDFDVTIFCTASEVCTREGVRTVTDWQPLPEIAAFLGKAG